VYFGCKTRTEVEEVDLEAQRQHVVTQQLLAADEGSGARHEVKREVGAEQLQQLVVVTRCDG
jgi:hypothetical protein